MTDGTLSVRRRDPKASETAEQGIKQAALSQGSYEYFADMEAVFGRGHVKPKKEELPPVVGPADEYRAEGRRKDKLKDFDKFLKAFNYSAALDAGLKKVSTKRNLMRSRLTILAECQTVDHICGDTRIGPARCTSDSPVWTRRCDARTHIGFPLSKHYRSSVWPHGK